MTKYLYLKIARCATWLLVVACALPALGQYSSARRSEPSRTTRAVGVFELDAHGLPRLYPVMLMLEGKIYVASPYGSRPVPMAIWGDTVYEVQKSGMPTGLFTLNLARRLGTEWWGEGRWKSFAADEKKDTKTKDKKSDKAKQVSKDDDADRPTLKKPKAESASSPEPGKPETKDTNAPPETTKPDQKDAKDDAEKVPPKRSRSASGPDDPDRPVLRRGMPVGTSQVKDTSNQPYEVVTPAKAKDLNASRGAVQSFVAVSDASPSDNRPFDLQLGPDEQEKYGKDLARQAWNELKKYAGASAGLPAEPAFSNVSIRSFDLDYSNNPVLVYSAEYKPGPLPPPRTTSRRGQAEPAAPLPSARPVRYYVTWVVKVDLQGEINKLFVSSTDSAHLDVTPRLVLIDVVDADGDNRAELLFRQVSDVGHDYVIYRGSPYWAKMFEGAGTR